MNVRLRFKDPANPVRYIRGRDLVPHPLNWRTHPEGQQNALRGVLAEVGLADVVKGYELPDGRVQVIDGHLRAEVLPDQDIPVLILDVTADEANRLLATFDAVGDLAGVNAENLELLLGEVRFQNAAVTAMLEDLAKSAPPVDAGGHGEGGGGGEEEPPAARWGVLVDCAGEPEQVRLIGLLVANGYEGKFRALVG
jgi:hypothetical protein